MKIDYSLLHTFAEAKRISYNDLCAVVVASISEPELAQAIAERNVAERFAARQVKRAEEAQEWSNKWKTRYKALVGNGTKAHAEKVAAKLSRATFVHMKLRDALLKITHAGLSEDVRAIAKEALTSFPLREPPTHTGPNRHPSTGLTAPPVGKEFHEQHTQPFPERRTGEADRRKVFDCGAKLNGRYGYTGRRVTDKFDYTSLPKINEPKT